MKKKIVYVLALLVFLTLLGCPDDDRLKYYGVWISNNSDQDITSYIACDINCDRVYPDTTISLNCRSVNIKSKAYFKYGFSTRMHTCDTLSVYIFSTDTISKYGWEKVRDDYLILKRFDLSWDDIKRMEWEVSFP